MFLQTRSTDLELKWGLAEAGRPEPLIRVVNFANLNREPVRNVGNFRNFPDFSTHKTILPQSSADFKKIVSDQIIEYHLKFSGFHLIFAPLSANSALSTDRWQCASFSQ
jgi:hypothetical protein